MRLCYFCCGSNAYIRDFTYPVGKDMKVSFPCMKVVAAKEIYQKEM